MKKYILTLIGMALLSFVVNAETTSVNRFDENTPRLLEKDSIAVMTKGLTYDYAKNICMRLGDPTAQDVTTTVVEWRARNDLFFRAAASALNEFGDKYKPLGGDKGKQKYLRSVLYSTVRIAKTRILRQLKGAGLDNNILPPKGGCLGLIKILNSNKSDIKNKPKITQALIQYMKRKGIK